MDWFYLYFLGLIIVISGVALGLNLIGVPPLWILGIVLVLAALAVLNALRTGRDGDPPS